MTYVVHHYFPHGSSNVGDALVAHAIQKAMRRHWGSLEFVNVAVNNRIQDKSKRSGLCGENVTRTNREADLVVIGGSNLLEPKRLSARKTASSPWHWGVQTDLQSIQALKIPVLLVGMGTGSDWGQPIRSYTTKAAAEVSALHQKAFASAVRDEPTRERLAMIGVNTLCTGCPVTFLTDRPVKYADGDKPLLVSLPPARILKTWSGRWFMHQTMNYLRWLKQKDISFVATLHERADLDFAPSWVPRGTQVFYTADVSELIDRYEDSCGVIGFRLHAALLSLGLGKPIVPVNVDWRGRAFTHTFGLDDVALEPNAWGQFRRLRQLTMQLLHGDEMLVGRLRTQKQQFQQRFHFFLEQAEAEYQRRNSMLMRAAG